jgi:hypothetical protein
MSDLPLGTHLELDVSPRPIGSVQIDPANGEFSYTADSKDFFQFTATFTAVSPGGSAVERNQVTVTPMPAFSSEFQTLFSESEVPSPDSQEYMTLSEQPAQTEELFNNAQRKTVDVIIVGNVLIFDASTNNNVLFSRFGSRLDIKNISIAADTLVIRGLWHLPQATLRIYARRLVFEDKPNEAPSCLDITPRSDWMPAKPADKGIPAGDGMNGVSAGDLDLKVQEMVFPSLDHRLIARGGNGQTGGKGRNGDSGAVHLPGPGQPGWVGFPRTLPPGAVFPPGTVYLITIPNNTFSQAEGGTLSWPDDGENALPAGKPGEPGNGGHIISTIAIADGLIDVRGGLPGETGAKTSGGASGTPKLAQRVQYYSYVDIRAYDHHDSIDGKDADPPKATLQEGNVGVLSVESTNLDSWVHPLALGAVINRVKDLYINNHLDEAREILQAYSNLDQNATSLSSELRSQIVVEKLEIAAMLHRLSVNEDYFGNRAGWTPLLSFEINLSSFRNEINTAIPIMFTHYWLSKHTNDIQSRNEALDQSMNQLRTLVQKDREALGSLQESLVKLHDQARALNRAMTELQKDIRVKEQELEARARDNVNERHKEPMWKEGLRCLGAVCAVIPVYQPVLGAIGAGLTTLSNIDTNTALTTIRGLISASNDLTDEKFKQSQEDFTKITSSIDLSSPESVMKGIKALEPVATKMADALDTVRKVTQGAQVSGSEIEAELARLKAEDPEFNDLIKKLEILDAKKLAFNELISAATQQLATLSENLTKDITSIDSMSREKSLNVSRLHPEVQLYINDLDRRAREILLEYHYRLAKAYEYRLLKRYTRRLNLDKLVDKFSSLVDDQKHGAGLSGDEINQLALIYQGTLSEIVADVQTEFNNNPPKRSGRVVYDLTAQEIKDLNDKNDVVINLMNAGYLNAAEENQRIVSMQISKIDIDPLDSDVTTPTTTIRFEPSSTSHLRSDGKLYSFRYPTSVSWGANVVGAGPQAKKFPQKLSASNDSLLVSLLSVNDPTVDPSKVLFFSEFGAWSDIHIRKSVVPPSVKTSVSRLQISLEYEFRDAPDTEVVLQVQPPRGVNPYIEIGSERIDGTDLNGQTGGIGQLFRIYPAGTSLHIAAPPQFGVFTFSEWRSNSEHGPVVSHNSAFDEAINQSVTLFPIYKPTK